MKNVLFVAIINILVLGSLDGQSKTFEITPEFYTRNNEFKSNEIPFIPTKETLEFIGLSCYHFDLENVGIFYRLKTDGEWTSWLKFDQQHEFVESSRSAYQTKPIQKSFSDIQFKTSEKLKSALTVRFFLASEEKNNTPQSFENSYNCDKPDVCGRDCWCPTCPIDNSPEFTEPTHLIVHHSAGNNESINFAMVVNFIWDLHVNTNGWDDIGYNWLIDPNGVLYEGRPDDYQGAHFSCLNENTVGICVIGDYTSVEPSEASLSTLVNILAFEATENGIDVNAQSYHVKGDFYLDNIAGHRNSSGSTKACSSTVCPGDMFYPLLPNIRLRVSELDCYNNVQSAVKENNHEEIKVFPNPIQDHLFINSDKQQLLTLEIVDMSGKSLGFVNSGKANDVSYLNAGVYFLLHNGKFLQKIIKM